jgi:ketosteroid isomerase-like protein
VKPSAAPVAMTDLELARRFLDALKSAAQTGEKEAVYPFLASDVVWITPKRTLQGIKEIREELTWGNPPERLAVEFDDVTMNELGDGHVVSTVHEVYRVRETNEFAYARDRQIELTIHDGRISRYELRNVG